MQHVSGTLYQSTADITSLRWMDAVGNSPILHFRPQSYLFKMVQDTLSVRQQLTKATIPTNNPE